MSHSLFALFADLNSRPVLVVGGGAAAECKVEALLHAGALPRLVTHELSPRLQTWEQQGKLAWIAREFDSAALDHIWLVIAATNDAALNQRIAQMATERHIFSNVVDDAESSSFHLPAVVERGGLQVAISSDGLSDRGSVILVGAGSGDPGLLTLNALRAINQADVILHDRLVSDAVLQLARRDVLKIEVGKSAQGHSIAQEQIHALMLEHTRKGARVVRLKGGDSFVFGRGGEELEFLQAHGVAFQVVPGITAALACAAYAGIPLTHRDHAQSVRLLTAHCKDSHDTLDWHTLAQEKQTLAVYMGVAGLENFRARMIAAGRSPQTPFALVENGSRPEQRVITGTLDDLPDTACHYQVQSPALLLLGEVTALAGRLHWFGAAPLSAPVASAHPRQHSRAHALACRLTFPDWRTAWPFTTASLTPLATRPWSNYNASRPAT